MQTETVRLHNFYGVLVIVGPTKLPKISIPSGQHVFQSRASTPWSLFLAPICRIIFVILRLTSVNGIMSFTVHFEQGGDSSEDALIARLRRFVEDY